MFGPNVLTREWLDRLPVAICACDRDGLVTAWNQRAVELWGREPEAGAKFSGAVRVYDSSGKQIESGSGPIAGILRSGRALRNIELTLEKPDGTRITTLSSVAPVRDERGTLLGVIDVFQDISDRKRIEEARRVAERLAASARIASDVSRQIHNPLASITSLLEVLRNEAHLSSEARTQADKVTQQLNFFERLKREMTLLSSAASVALAEG